MQLSRYTPMMAAERFQKINDVLDMFYGPPEDDEILPISLEPVRVCFWQARTDFGDWQHAWKMDVPRGENGDLIDFAEKKTITINVVKNELQSLGMIKVELAAVLEMSKRNEEGVITYLIIIT